MVGFTKADGRISKTMIFNALAAMSGTLVLVLPEVRDTIPPWLYALIWIAGSIINAALRQITVEPME